MGPFDIDRQYKRMESVKRLLSQPDLPPSTQALWQHVLNNIALDENTYNARVMWTYRNHRKEIIDYGT